MGLTGLRLEMKRYTLVLATLIFWLAMGFVVGQHSAHAAETTGFDPHDQAQCASYDGTLIYNNISACRHHDVREISVLYEADTYGADYLQLVREVLASWSIPGVFGVSLGGEAPTGVCDPLAPTTRGVIYLCDAPDRWGYQLVIDPTQPYPYPHYKGGRMWLQFIGGGYNDRGVACHEFGHLWGLSHGALDPDEGCMDWKSNTPGPFALQKLAELMEHLEGGVPLPTATVTPTPTRSATPTVTATANLTPTTYPGPSCWPPKAKRCR